MLLAVGVVGAVGAQPAAEDAAEPTPAEPPAEDPGDLTYPIPRHDIVVPLPPDLLEPGADPVQAIVRIVISAEGLVTASEISASSGVEAVDAAALRAAALMTFLPATLDGEAVEVTIEYPIVFLAPEPPPPAVLPAELRGRVEERGSMKPLESVEVSLYAAEYTPDEDEDEGEDEIGDELDLELELDPDDVEIEDFTLAEEPLLTAYTDAEGHFAISDIPPGLYVAACGFAGFRVEKYVEVLPEGTVRDVIYRIRPNAVQQTVVIARKESDTPERILSGEELKTIPGAGRDPMAAVQSLPGVVHTPPSYTASEMVQTPVLRGAAGEDSVMYLDGLPTPIIFHTMSTFSITGDSIIDRAFLKPAAVEASYGDLTGGVVGLDLRSPRRDRIGGIFDPGIGLFSFNIEGPIRPKSRFHVGIRRSYYDILMKLILPRDLPLDFVTAPYFQDQQVILETDITPWMTWQIGYLGTMDGMKLLFEDDDEEEDQLQEQLEFTMRTDLHRIFLKIDTETKSGFTNRLHPALTFWSYDFTFADFFASTDRHTTFHLKDDLHLPLTPWLSLDAGGILEVDKLKQYRNVPQQSRESEGGYGGEAGQENLIGRVDEKRTWLGGYVSVPIQPVEPLTIVPEFRVDYFGKLGAAIPQVRGRIGVQPHERVRISLAGGRYVQSPSYEELSDTTGNPDLRSEGAWHLNLGAAVAPGPWLDLDVQGYVKWLDHQVVSSVSSSDYGGWGDLGGFEDLIDTEDDPTHGLSNDGIGRIYGAEVFARFDFARKLRFSGWVGYGLCWAERKDFPDEDWHWFQYDRRHQLTVLMQLTFPREVILGARFQLQSGAPMTPVEDATFYPDIGWYLPEYGELYSERGLPFVQLDLRIDKRWRKNNHIVDFYVDLQNITMAKSSDFVLYSFDYRESASFMSFPAINLALRIEF